MGAVLSRPTATDPAPVAFTPSSELGAEAGGVTLLDTSVVISPPLLPPTATAPVPPALTGRVGAGVLTVWRQVNQPNHKPAAAINTEAMTPPIDIHFSARSNPCFANRTPHVTAPTVPAATRPIAKITLRDRFIYSSWPLVRLLHWPT
jgi:hypothetical protein